MLYSGDERIFLQDLWEMEATYLMFLPLAAPERDEYGEPQPVLAQRWEYSEDYREWTFFLREDVELPQFRGHPISWERGGSRNWGSSRPDRVCGPTTSGW